MALQTQVALPSIHKDLSLIPWEKFSVLARQRRELVDLCTRPDQRYV